MFQVVHKDGQHEYPPEVLALARIRGLSRTMPAEEEEASLLTRIGDHRVLLVPWIEALGSPDVVEHIKIVILRGNLNRFNSLEEVADYFNNGGVFYDADRQNIENLLKT